MAIIRVLDIETTGIDPASNKVIEIAAYDVHSDDKRVERVGSHLVNPGRPIPPEASAVHHLIDADVAAAETFDAVWKSYVVNAPIYYAAHNCDFERAYVPTPASAQWICTYKSALRAWSDAPGHSNQVLRYWMGLDGAVGFDREIAAQAHRAEADAYVTAWILMRLLDQVAIDDLLSWTNEPRLYPRLTFGKYRSLKWAEVPEDYLRWLRDGQHQLDGDWRHGANVELERRTKTP